MSRYRLYPTPEQEQVLLGHCGHARYVWNLAVEQLGMRHHQQHAPGYAEQNRQLTEARAAYEWLAAGSATVQQRALRDFTQTMSYWRAGTHRRPTWRKRGEHEGFGIVGAQAQRVEQVNRRWSRVLIPKVGWVRFRRTRVLPEARSYRVNRDRAGRWHIAFAAPPEPIPAPGNGMVVGVDRGVAISAMTSAGDALRCPGLRPKESERLLRLQRKASRQHRRGQPASNRLLRTRHAIARLHARESDRRKNWIEQTSTDLARRFDLIRVEDLRIVNMTRSARGTVEAPGRNVRAKAGLNRGVLAAGWGGLARRLEDKALGRVERVSAAYTSQRCSVCGHTATENRKSQAVFACVACGHTSNADLNAARNIAAGRAVTAREASALAEAVNRELQRAAS